MLRVARVTESACASEVLTWHSSRGLTCGCCSHPQGFLLFFAILLRLLVLFLQQGICNNSGCKGVTGAPFKRIHQKSQLQRTSASIPSATSCITVH